jgi:hypothetical protein
MPIPSWIHGDRESLRLVAADVLYCLGKETQYKKAKCRHSHVRSACTLRPMCVLLFVRIGGNPRRPQPVYLTWVKVKMVASPLDRCCPFLARQYQAFASANVSNHVFRSIEQCGLRLYDVIWISYLPIWLKLVFTSVDINK